MSSGRTIVKNIIWRFLERTGTQIVTLIVSVILARLLAPELYGVLALITALIAVLSVPLENGLCYSLVQKKEADSLDFSTVFFCNLAFALALFALMFFSAPLIASIYGKQELIALIRVLSLSLIVTAVKSIQQAYAARHMLFKRFFYSSMGGTVFAGIAAIILALKGFGIWALAAQYLLDAAADTAILWFTVHWRPQREFSAQRFREMFSYAWKLIVSAFLDSGYEGLKQTLIGLRYSPADLGFFNKAQTLPNAAAADLNASAETVLFSAMSREQGDPDRVKSMTQKMIQTNTFILAPVMTGLAAIAEPLVRVVLTEKWLPCVPLLRICCLAYIFTSAVKANQCAINAMGRSDLFLKQEYIKKAFSFLVLLIAIRFGVLGVAYGLLITKLICLVVNAFPNGKLLGYPISEQLGDLAPPILLAAGMGFAVFCVTFFHLNDWQTLFIQIPLGVLIYYAGARILRLKGYVFLLDFIKNTGNGYSDQLKTE